MWHQDQELRLLLQFVLLEKWYVEQSEAGKLLNSNYEKIVKYEKLYTERSEAKNAEKLNRAQKCSILEPRYLGPAPSPFILDCVRTFSQFFLLCPLFFHFVISWSILNHDTVTVSLYYQWSFNDMPIGKTPIYWAKLTLCRISACLRLL